MLADESRPKTLLDFSGVTLAEPKWEDSTLIVIDAQREYTEGKARLHNVDTACGEISTLLAKAREAGAPVVHVFHKTPSGAPIFAQDGPTFPPIEGLEPRDGEAVVEKTNISAFAKTPLADILEKHGRKSLVVVGFMTHMCVSTTVRQASEFGYMSTVVAKATATRDLPNPLGGVVTAEAIQASSLAELGDRFALVVPDATHVH